MESTNTFELTPMLPALFERYDPLPILEAVPGDRWLIDETVMRIGDDGL